MIKIYKLNFRINVTEHCNFNCDYCIEKSQLAKNRYDNFDIKKSIELLEDCIKKYKQGLFVSFFGGEPTLKKEEIMVFLNSIKDKEYFKDLRFEITTNSYIFFPEIINFCKEYNSNLKIMISYDGIGQNFRNKNENVNEIVRKNIKKYVNMFKKYNMNISLITVNCCVVEENSDKIFDSYQDIINLGIRSVKFSTVFTEHWKNDSFKNMYKSYNRIYDFVIANNKSNKKLFYLLPTIDGGHKDEWKKFNSLLYQTKKDKDTVKKIDISYISFSETIERRYINKKHYKIKPIYIDKNIDYPEDIELLSLRETSFNYTYFDKLTMVLLLGDNVKKYKKEIYSLFNFDNMLCNKYKKTIKSLIKKNRINIYNYLKEYSYTLYFNNLYSKDISEKILKDIDKYLDYYINFDKIIINKKELNLFIKKQNNGIYIKNIIYLILEYILDEITNKYNIDFDINIKKNMCINFYKYIYKIRSKNRGD